MALKIKNKKLWLGIVFTALVLLVYRLACMVQLPWLLPDNVEALSGSQPLFGFLDIFSGGALSNFSVVALGVTPYITASIVVQLLQMDIVPVFKEWSEEGAVGKEKLNTATKYIALGLAFIQALTLVIGISVSYSDFPFAAGFDEVGVNKPLIYMYLSLVMVAGTAVVLWLADKVTKRGVGNGTSLFIVAGIISSFPTMIAELLQQYILNNASIGGIFVFIGVILLLVLIIVGVVFMEQAQRKIPIQYANRPSQAAFRGRNDSNIPIKLNSASVIPVIFASTLMSLPTTIANFITNSTWKMWLTNIFSSSEPIGFALYIILIYVFSFFYTFLQMSPDKMAENLQKQNAYIPGIRPGEETASYISRVLFKITMVGATYLAVLAALPIIVAGIFDLPASVQIGGTSLIIVVGVAIETAKQIKQTSQEKEYHGFLD